MSRVLDYDPNDYDPSVCYTIPQLADYWQVPHSTIYSLIKKKKLKAFKVGVQWRITDRARFEYENDSFGL